MYLIQCQNVCLFEERWRDIRQKEQASLLPLRLQGNQIRSDVIGQPIRGVDSCETGEHIAHGLVPIMRDICLEVYMHSRDAVQ